jgi:hypothetical protein
MAFPSIRSSANTNGTSATTTPVVNLPATIAAGDTIWVVIRNAAAGAIGWPDATWTEDHDASPDGAVGQTAIAWKKAVGGEGGTTITLSSANGKFSAIAIAVRDAADPSVRSPQLSTVATGTVGAEPNATTCTPTGGAKDYLWYTFFTMEGEQTGITAYPTNYTLNQTGLANSGTGGAVTTNATMAGAARQLNAASEDAPVWDVAGTIDDWSAWTVAFHPAEAVPSLLQSDDVTSPHVPQPRRVAHGLTNFVMGTSLALLTLAQSATPFVQLNWPVPSPQPHILTTVNTRPAEDPPGTPLRPVLWEVPARKLPPPITERFYSFYYVVDDNEPFFGRVDPVPQRVPKAHPSLRTWVYFKQAEIGPINLSAGAQTGTLTAPDATTSAVVTLTQTAQTGTLTAPTATVAAGGVSLAQAVQGLTATAPTATATPGAVSLTQAAQTGTLTAPVATAVAGGISLTQAHQEVTLTAPVAVAAATMTRDAGAQTGTLTAPDAVASAGGVSLTQAAQTGTLTAPTATVVPVVTLTQDAQTGTLTAPTAVASAVVTLDQTVNIGTLTAPTAVATPGAVTVSATASTVTLTALDAEIQASGGPVTRNAGDQILTATAPTASVTVGGVSRAAGEQIGTLTAPSAVVSSAVTLAAASADLTLTAPVAEVSTTSDALQAGINTVTLTAPVATATAGAITVQATAAQFELTAPVASTGGSSVLPATVNTLTLTNAVATRTATVTLDAGVADYTITAPAPTVSVTGVTVQAAVNTLTITAPVAVITATPLFEPLNNGTVKRFSGTAIVRTPGGSAVAVSAGGSAELP